MADHWVFSSITRDVLAIGQYSLLVLIAQSLRNLHVERCVTSFMYHGLIDDIALVEFLVKVGISCMNDQPIATSTPEIFSAIDCQVVYIPSESIGQPSHGLAILYSKRECLCLSRVVVFLDSHSYVLGRSTRIHDLV